MRPDTTPENLLLSLPMFDDTDETSDQSCDWPAASYEATSTPAPVSWSWSVFQSLTGAPGIEDLMTQGHAVYAVETVCAKSMHSVMSYADPKSDTMTVFVNEDLVFGEFILFPGVVTVSPCVLDPTGTDWDPLGPINVPAGRWLAKSAPLPVVPEAYDPLVLRSDDEIDPPHRFEITYSASPDVHFIITARPERIEAIRAGNHAALMFCWATALAMLPSMPECTLELQDDGSMRVPGSKMVDGLARILESKGIELWGDGDGNLSDSWDPVAAASAQVEVPPYEPPQEP